MRLFCTSCNRKRDTNETFVDHTNADGTLFRIHHCVECDATIHRPLQYQPFIELSFDVACERKFQIGRAEHGPVFLNNPLEEIDLELIDAVNYAEEGIKQGYPKEELERIIIKLKEVDVMVRTLHAASKH